MNFFNTRGINLEAFCKVTILLGLSYYFFQTAYTGRALLYVHPKMLVFVYFGAAAMAFMALMSAGELFKIPRQNMRVFPYALFLLTLVLALGLPPVTLGSGTLAGRNVDLGQREPAQDREASSPPPGDGQEGSPDSSPGEGLEPVDGRIFMDQQNFMSWIFKVYTYTSSYVGNEIIVTGFVHRVEEYAEDEFVIARFVMSCCIADMQIAGILCRFEDASRWPTDTWVRVKGTLIEGEYGGHTSPIIVSVEVTEEERPYVEYVYFN